MYSLRAALVLSKLFINYGKMYHYALKRMGATLLSNVKHIQYIEYHKIELHKDVVLGDTNRQLNVYYIYEVGTTCKRRNLRFDKSISDSKNSHIVFYNYRASFLLCFLMHFDILRS